MRCSKIAYVKFDDAKALIESLKSIMKSYDMEFEGVRDDKYSFSRYGDYFRSFKINECPNGWISLYDDDSDQAEQLCSELSKSLSCFILSIGIVKDVLCYTVFDGGEQIGQYMSSLKYYEYAVDDDIESMYAGDAEVFKDVVDAEDIDKLQEVLQECRDGCLDVREVAYSIQKLLKIIEADENEGEDGTEGKIGEGAEDAEEGGGELLQNIFYVDFMSINIKSSSIDDVLSAVENICNDMGFVKVDEFYKDDGKKGFFKKMLNSVKERRRLQFFVSQPLNGWITLVGEMQRLNGDEPSEWEFIHIEDRISEILNVRVIGLFANPEGWGFKIFENGSSIYEYNSGDVIYIEDIENVLPGAGDESISSIFDSDVGNANDVDRVFGEFCNLLGIKNAKINIPMDYSEDEYYNNVLKPLPGGESFMHLKFEPKK